MKKVDPKQELQHLYRPSAKKIVEVDVPSLRFLAIDGEGDPNASRAYADAVEALFSVSYTAKFMMKRAAQGIDYAVMPLEGLWWSEDMSSFLTDERSKWKWTMMIMQPRFVDAAVIDESIAQVKRKKKALAATGRLTLRDFKEGRCAQTLHIGPFTEEGPTIQRLHDFIAARSALAGKHHEIYLSDIRRADPARWKTIIRQPME